MAGDPFRTGDQHDTSIALYEDYSGSALAVHLFGFASDPHSMFFWSRSKIGTLTNRLLYYIVVLRTFGLVLNRVASGYCFTKSCPD